MMSTTAARLDRALRAAGFAITGVSIGDEADRSTWKVFPVNLQTAAQPTIDTFNPNDPALEAAELDDQVKAAVDQERLTSAIVWCIIDTYSPPATVTKYQAARTKIINAYKLTPWK
jgi:hypothetical protein